MHRNLAALLLLGAALPALAQPYPSRQILLLSGASVGSGGDIAMRAVVTRMADALGQPIVVESRRGAGGLEAYTAGARAEPNGYTLTFANGGLVTNRFMKKNMPVDAVKDYTPIVHVFNTVFFIAAHSGVPANSLKELIEYSKRNPGKLDYATTGVGSVAHLVGESLNQQAGMGMVHVPYSGGNTATVINDLVTGRVHLYLAALPSFTQHVAAGRVKLIAYVDRQRSRLRPEVPTVNETLPGYYNIVVWYGFLGPVGLPRPIVDRIRIEANKATADPSLAPKFDTLGMSVVTGQSSEEFARQIASDVEHIGKVVKELQLKPE